MQVDSNGKPIHPSFYVIQCSYYEYYNVIIIQLRVNDTGAALDAPTPARRIIVFAISFIYLYGANFDVNIIRTQSYNYACLIWIIV